MCCKFRTLARCLRLICMPSKSELNTLNRSFGRDRNVEAYLSVNRTAHKMLIINWMKVKCSHKISVPAQVGAIININLR